MTGYLPKFLHLISRMHPRTRLILGWSTAWRLWSVRIATFSAGLMTAWSSLPLDLRSMLPCSDRTAAALFVAIAIARMIAQDHATHGATGGETAA